MRKTFKKSVSSLKKNIHMEFINKGLDEEEDKIFRFIESELILYAFEKSFPKTPLTVENCFSVFPNHKALLPTPKFPTQLDALRVMIANTINREYIKNIMGDYEKFENNFKLYYFDESDNVFKKKVPTVLQDREVKYFDYFLSTTNVEHKKGQKLELIKEKDQNISFIKKESNKDIKVILNTKEENYATKHGKPALIRKSYIPSYWIGENGYEGLKDNSHVIPLPKESKEKDKMNLPLGNDNQFLDAAEKMNKEKRSSRDWVISQKNLRLLSLTEDKKEVIQAPSVLDYRSSFGISGLVGAGKTTFIMLETYRLVKMLGKKVGIITTNTTNTIEMVYELYMLGIKATPIIGKSSEKKHLKNFIKKVEREQGVKHNNHPLSQLALEYIMGFFGGKCMIKANTDTSDETRNPCFELSVYSKEKEGYLKKVCPLFKNCGVYVKEMQLNDSPVWIGTPHSFAVSSPGKFFDEMDRPYLTILREQMDVIFADEADGLQETFDDIFNSKNSLFGDNNYLFENIYTEATSKLVQYHTTANDARVNLFEEALVEARKATKFIYGLLQSSKDLRAYLDKRTFGTKQILSKITKSLFALNPDDDVTKHEFYKEAKKITVKANKKYIEEIFSNLNEFKSDDSLNDEERHQMEIGLFKQKLEEILGNIPSSVSSNVSNDCLKENSVYFAFYMFLETFDTYLKRVLNNKEYVKSKIGAKFKDNEMTLKITKEYLPFMPEPVTGRGFQYSYKESNENQKWNKIGNFSVYEYLSVGRALFTELEEISKNIDGEGATVVYLSGSSHAVGSPNYHVNVKTKYLLESTLPNKSEIYQISHMVKDENGEPVFVSGNPQKEKALRKIAKSMVPLLKEELTHWESEGRKMLLVANSYVQCEAIYEELEKYFPGKVKCLTNKEYFKQEDKVKKEDYVIRDEVSFFSQSKSDILIVPLNSINRGYNILQEGTNKSLFGSVFFMVRPYLVNSEIGNIIKLLNGFTTMYIEEAIEEGKFFDAGVNYVRKRANADFERYLTNDESWSQLKDEEKKIIAWYTFVNVWQMIGRLLRGNTNARVHYMDAKFSINSKEEYQNKKKKGKTMLEIWKEILKSDKSIVTQKLYEGFSENIDNAIK